VAVGVAVAVGVSDGKGVAVAEIVAVGVIVSVAIGTGEVSGAAARSSPGWWTISGDIGGADVGRARETKASPSADMMATTIMPATATDRRGGHQFSTTFIGECSSVIEVTRMPRYDDLLGGYRPRPAPDKGIQTALAVPSTRGKGRALGCL